MGQGVKSCWLFSLPQYSVMPDTLYSKFPGIWICPSATVKTGISLGKKKVNKTTTNHTKNDKTTLKTNFWPVSLRHKTENQNIRRLESCPAESLTGTKSLWTNERTDMRESTHYRSCSRLQALFRTWAWPPPAALLPADSLAPSPGRGFLTWCWSCWV